MNKRLITISWLILASLVNASDFDQQRPEGISEATWGSLRSAVLEAKLLPTPEGIGGSRGEFGRNVFVDGNRAVIGGPYLAGGGAVLVLDYDGQDWNESARLIPADGEAGDLFGWSVSLSGNRVAIGAYKNDASQPRTGAAYIFDFDGNSWNESAKLMASDAASGDYFGWSVGLSGNTMMIGAKDEGDAFFDSGAVYVFKFDGLDWNEVTKLKASDANYNDQFGVSLSLSGNRALIGSMKSSSRGAAYIFDFDGNTWVETAKLMASDPQSSDFFSQSVSLSGDRALIGAPLSYVPEPSNNQHSQGAAYIFDYDGNTWNETIKLNNPDPFNNDYFGYSVSLSDNRALIGVAYDNDQGTSSGSAYIYEFDGNLWSETQKLIASDGYFEDYFGYSVSLSGNRALVGAYGDELDGIDSGSAYVFDFDQSQWNETKLEATAGAVKASFGYSISIFENRALVGAPGQSTVYVYDYDGQAWAQSAILTASDGEIIDAFGSSVALTQNRALIGAKSDWGPGVYAAGSAYVFDFDGQNWQESTKIVPPDIESLDGFGIAVSLSGDRALISSVGDDVLGEYSGSVYAYKFNGTQWLFESKITASNGSSFDRFGSFIKISADKALIGAAGFYSAEVVGGSAYVFEYDGNNWVETDMLFPSGADDQDNFGTSGDIIGNRVLIGANHDNDLGENSGSAFVFEFNGQDWVETAKLLASNGAVEDGFGSSVSLAGNRALVGSPMNDSQYPGHGAVYLYQFNGLNWIETNQLSDDDNRVQDFFGYAINLSDDHAFVGAFGDDDRGTDSGSVHAFQLENIYSISGTMTGLAIGNEVMVQINNADFMSVASNGAFAFNVFWDDLSEYSVTVQTHPTSPNQTCLVTGGSNGDGTGTVNSVDVTDIVITCNNNPYNVNIDVSGLLGDGVGFSNGLDTLMIVANGVQTLSTLDDDSAFHVNMTDQPESPDQVCSFTSADSGVLAGNDVTVSVACETVQYMVGADITGLAANNSVVLQNNGGDDLIISTNGFYNFDLPLDDGSSYLVSISSQPTNPNQMCLVSQGAGQINGGNVTNVTVSCQTNIYAIGGEVTGLALGNSVVLTNNAGDDTAVLSSNSSFVFAELLEDESAFSVTVLNHPNSPNQTCTVVNGNGVLAGNDVTDIVVSCVTRQYFIGGYAFNLIPNNFMVLQNNGSDDVIITEEGAFVFTTPIEDEQSYDVTISYQPDDPIQTCELVNGSGQLNGNDINNVLINCELGDDLIFRHGFDATVGISEKTLPLNK